MTDFETMLTVEACAAKYGLAPTTVYAAITKGLLPVYRFGRRGLAVSSEAAEKRWGHGHLKSGPKAKAETETESE